MIRRIQGLKGSKGTAAPTTVGPAELLCCNNMQPRHSATQDGSKTEWISNSVLDAVSSDLLVRNFAIARILDQFRRSFFTLPLESISQRLEPISVFRRTAGIDSRGPLVERMNGLLLWLSLWFHRLGTRCGRCASHLHFGPSTPLKSRVAI